MRSIFFVNVIGVLIGVSTKSDSAYLKSENSLWKASTNLAWYCFIKGECNINHLLSVVSGGRQDTLEEWNQLEYSPSFNVKLEGINADWCWKHVQDLGRSYFDFGVHHVSLCNFTRKHHNTTDWMSIWSIHHKCGVYLWVFQFPGVGRERQKQTREMGSCLRYWFTTKLESTGAPWMSWHTQNSYILC